MTGPRPVGGYLITRIPTLLAWLAYVVLIAPIVVTVVMSFGNQYSFEFPPRTVSLFLYRKFLTDPTWMGAVGLSLRIALVSTALSLAIGIPAAYGLVRGAFPGKRLVA